MTGFEQAIATGISWVIVLVWVGVMTYFIDLLGEEFGWWSDD